MTLKLKGNKQLKIYRNGFSSFLFALPFWHQFYNSDGFSVNISAKASVVFEGITSGITVFKEKAWIVEVVPNGSLITYKVHQIGTLGTSIKSFEIPPADGGKNNGGGVAGIAFVKGRLWYLNPALLKIVKSDIQENM